MSTDRTSTVPTRSDPVATAAVGDDVADGVDAVGRALRRVIVRTSRYTDAAGARSQTHRTHLNALALLMDARLAGVRMTPGHLGGALGLGSGATTALVDRLEAAGHAQRTRSENDRRVVHIDLTEEALSVGRSMFLPLQARMHNALEGFTAHELAVTARVLGAVEDAVERAAADVSAVAEPR